MAYGTSGSSAEGKTLFSNLAVGKTTDSKAIVQFLEGLSEERVEFSASEYDAVVGFFEGKEYTREATPVVLSQLVAEILNANRYKTSVLGYKQARDTADHINRNIKA